MKCDEARHHWHLFHDSEGDAELHLQINEHLEMCPECARWFFEQSRLEHGVTRKLKATLTPTASLWAAVEGRLVPAEKSKSRNWFLLGSAAVVAACFFMAVGHWWQQDGQDSATAPDLSVLSVTLHNNFVTGREEVKFASASHIDVENYLREQVSFPVRCPPREDAGFQVRGGGTCQLADDPAAYVVGDVDGQAVSLFILSKDSMPNFPVEQALLRNRSMHQWREGNTEVVMKQFDRNLVLVVGQAARAQLERVLEAYGSYPHNHDDHREEPHSAI